MRKKFTLDVSFLIPPLVHILPAGMYCYIHKRNLWFHILYVMVFDLGVHFQRISSFILAEQNKNIIYCWWSIMLSLQSETMSNKLIVNLSFSPLNADDNALTWKKTISCFIYWRINNLHCFVVPYCTYL